MGIYSGEMLLLCNSTFKWKSAFLTEVFSLTMVYQTKYSKVRHALSPTLVKALGWEHQHTLT